MLRSRAETDRLLCRLQTVRWPGAGALRESFVSLFKFKKFENQWIGHSHLFPGKHTIRTELQILVFKHSISLKENKHLNDIGLMRRRAMKGKSQAVVKQCCDDEQEE